MPFVSHVMRKWVTAIPKTQGRSDLETIRSISKALKENDVIGLFPEGTRTWTGDTLDIVGGTAKLVRLFKVPVIFINIEGGFAKKPRWANQERKGPICLNVTKILWPEEIAKMSLAEINQCVEENLIFKHDKWINENPNVSYSGPVAEGVERVLYACPKCGSFSTMVSSDNSLSCSKCGAKADVDGQYKLSSDSISFKSIAEWNNWEKELIHNTYLEKSEDELFFPEDKCILFQKSIEDKFADLSENFSVKAFKNRLEFNFEKPVEGKSLLVFDFAGVESLVVNTKQTVDFFYNGVRYRFRPDGMISSLKYQELYQEYLNNKEA